MNSIKILLVDNDETICFSLIKQFHKINSKIEVLVANSYKEGMKFIVKNQTTINVVIIDTKLLDVKEEGILEYSIQILYQL